jgi:hypothetical protein
MADDALRGRLDREGTTFGRAVRPTESEYGPTESRALPFLIMQNVI